MFKIEAKETSEKDSFFITNVKKKKRNLRFERTRDKIILQRSTTRTYIFTLTTYIDTWLERRNNVILKNLIILLLSFTCHYRLGKKYRPKLQICIILLPKYCNG